MNRRLGRLAQLGRLGRRARLGGMSGLSGLSGLLALGLLTACDRGAKDGAAAGEGGAKVAVEGAADVEIDAELRGAVKAEALDLDAAFILIKEGKVKDAAELEAAINSPKKGLASIDIDGDGILDFVQVVELRDGDEVRFELRVVPSSTKDAEYAVPVATIVVQPEKSQGEVVVRATYTPVIVHHEVYIYEHRLPATWEGETVVVVGAPFVGWVYAPHPVYVGVYTHEHWIAAPGVVVHVGTRGKYKKYKKFKKHKKYKKHRKYKKFRGSKGHTVKVKF